jgi:hypothetical protein
VVALHCFSPALAEGCYAMALCVLDEQDSLSVVELTDSSVLHEAAKLQDATTEVECVWPQ